MLLLTPLLMAMLLPRGMVIEVCVPDAIVPVLVSTGVVLLLQWVQNRFALDREIELQWTTSKVQRDEFARLSNEIATLRRESNRVNNPSTFAEYALLQRKINKLIKQRDAMLEDTTPTPSSLLIAKLVTYLPQVRLSSRVCGVDLSRASLCSLCVLTSRMLNPAQMVVTLALLIYFHGATIFRIDIDPSTMLMSTLAWTPLRHFIGDVGMLSWLMLLSLATRHVPSTFGGESSKASSASSASASGASRLSLLSD